MLALVIPVGLLIGLSLGALGGGGSILTVPALVYLFGQDTRAATTGSLLVVGITSVIGMVPHHRAGRVSLIQGLVFGTLGVAGSYVGSQLSAAVRPDVLLAGFSALMLTVAALMTRRRRAQARLVADAGADVSAVAPPVLTVRPTVSCDCRRAVTVVLTASGVGLLTGFFGVGGGFAVVPALVLALGLSMPVAVGTSLVVIAINSVSALAFRLGDGVELDWWVIGGLTMAGVAGSLVGSRVVSRVEPARLNLAFTVLLVAVAIYTAARSVPGLL